MNTLIELRIGETQEKLRSWGRWYNAVIEMGLSFPKKSVIGQLIDSQGELIKSSVKQLAPENAEAELIDAIVNQFAEKEFEKAKILCIHYTSVDDKETKVKKTNLSKATYFRYLGIAERWICVEMNK